MQAVRSYYLEALTETEGHKCGLLLTPPPVIIGVLHIMKETPILLKYEWPLTLLPNPRHQDPSPH
jgi:hypothetical protein